jgi:transposase-like protein
MVDLREAVHAPQVGQLGGVELVALVRVFADPGVGRRVRDDDAPDERGDDAANPGRQFARRKTLRQIISTKVVPESVIYTDSFRSYDGLVLDGFRHCRINHQECFATSKRQHINGIENFRGYAKTKLKSYYGVSREHFYFYLKAMEFRFNQRKVADLAALIKKTVRKHQAVLDQPHFFQHYPIENLQRIEMSKSKFKAVE